MPTRNACLRRGALLIATFLSILPAVADEVVLEDGTRILGKVVGLGDGTLTIEGGSAGKVTIPFASVRTVVTEGEHTVVLADGRSVRGRLEMTPGGAPQLSSAAGAEAITFGQITAIDPPEKPPVAWNGNITVSAKATDGNTNTDSVASSAEAIRRTEDDRLTFFGAWNYSEEEGDVSQRNANGRGKYDYFLSERLFAYGNGSVEGDEFQDLSQRATVGAGAGYQFLDDETTQYYEEVGVSYVDEDFHGGIVEEYASSRFSGKFDWELVAKRVAFFHFHEVFWSLEDQDDVLVDTRTGFRFTLIANFFASVQVNYKWDNTPAAGKERDDTEYLLGLGYSFTF
jgi:putative salt-induced outer membrane protein YdiY